MISETSAKKYSKDDISKIENYDKAISDNTQIWDCHHRAEILPCGRFSVDDLKKFDLYWFRPASELIFLTKSEHGRLHGRRRQFSEETKEKWSKARKGKSLTYEHKMKISRALVGKKASEATKRKLSELRKGKPSHMRGTHQSEEARRRISEAKGQAVEQYTKDGVLLARFESQKKAALCTGISKGNISSCCNGRRKTAGGYIWRLI